MKKILFTILLVVILSITFLIPSSVQADDDGYFHSNTCYMHIGKWLWSGREWYSPPGSLGSIDLRSLPECAQNGGKIPASEYGYGIFFSKEKLGVDYYFLGTDFNSSIPLNVKTFLQQKWGISLEAYSNNGTLWELFVEEGDPTGETRWKPLQPKQDGTLEILINGFSPVVFAKDQPRFNCWNWHPYSYWRWGFNKWGFWDFRYWGR